MADVRPLSVLPAIKCSSCGVEITISSMGEHVCNSHESEFAIPMPRHELVSQRPDRIRVRPARAVPRPIDSSVASQSHHDPLCIFLALINSDQYSPDDLLSPASAVSKASSGRRSPSSPLSPAHAAHLPSKRSATSPLPRPDWPSSPDLSMNLDCAFPAFPSTKRPSTPSSGRSSPNEPRADARTDRAASPCPDQAPRIPPRSPRPEAVMHPIRRIDSMSPGPFGEAQQAAQKGSTGVAPPAARLVVPKQRRALVSGEDTASEAVQRSVSLPTARIQAEAPTPPQISPLPCPVNSSGRPAPPRPQRSEGVDDFLVQMRNRSMPGDQSQPPVPLRHEGRTRTFPIEAQTESRPTVIRSFTEPTEASSRSVSGSAGSTVEASEMRTDEDRSDSRLRNAPPVPLPPTIETKRDSRSPSDFASSDSSSVSSRDSDSLLASSPTSSAASSVSADWPISDVNTTNSGMTVNWPIPDAMAKKSNASAFSIQALFWKKEGRGDLRAQTKNTPAMEATQTSMLPSNPVVAGLDIGSSQPSSPSTNSIVALPDMKITNEMDQSEPQGPFEPVNESRSAPQADTTKDETITPQAAAVATIKRPGTGSKHHCRGCHEPITGKSVKAADGRLTGRYHKQCLTCKTCQSTFATADFYVLDNHPYCERHYHTLNNSLCATCDQGIEGQYTQTQTGEKHHSHCFSCADCRSVLTDDYFDIGGKVYCERHAFVAIRGHTGFGAPRDVTRRHTKLMVM